MTPIFKKNIKNYYCIAERGCVPNYHQYFKNVIKILHYYC